MTRKGRFLLGAAAGAIAAISPAMAADMAVKAPPLVPVYNWTGWYLGGNLGYSWGSGDSAYNQSTGPALPPISFAGSQNLDGVFGGPQIGYNWQINNTWVTGLETDFQWSGERGSKSFSDPYATDCEGVACSLSGTVSSKISWFGTARGRLGVLATPTLWLYGTGGLAYGRVNTSGTITNVNSPYSFPPSGIWSFGNSDTKVGWTAGAGVEGAIPNTTGWTWKVEYLYIDLGSVSGSGLAPCPLGCAPPPGPPFSWSTKFTDNLVRLGVNYTFK